MRKEKIKNLTKVFKKAWQVVTRNNAVIIALELAVFAGVVFAIAANNNLIILNVHSHPQSGDEWKVSFETTGRADLTIIPDDQATIDDLDFVSLKCGEQEKSESGSLQILEGDVIFYPDWECEETGEIIHLVNIAAPHVLKFQFGDEIAYAYNNPDESTYNFVGITQESNDYYAYEKAGAASFTSQDDTGDSEATNTDYDNIESTNDVRWSTDGAATDGHYDSQLYKFYIDEDESNVTQLDFTWQGYGETHGTDYPTDFYAWNYNTSQWDLLQDVTFTATTDQNLTGTKTTNAGDYIDTDKEVTLMTKTKKYVWTLNETTCNALSGWDWLNGACWSDSIMDYVSWNKGVGNDSDNPGAYTCNSGGTLKSRMEAAVVGHWSEICTLINGVTITSDYDGHGDAEHDGDATISALAISDCVDGTRDLCSTNGCLGSNGTEINTALNTWATATSSKSSLSQANTTCTSSSYCPEGNYYIGFNKYEAACVGDWYKNTSTLAPGTNFSWAAACGDSDGYLWYGTARLLGFNTCSSQDWNGTSSIANHLSFRVVVRP